MFWNTTTTGFGECLDCLVQGSILALATHLRRAAVTDASHRVSDHWWQPGMRHRSSSDANPAVGGLTSSRSSAFVTVAVSTLLSSSSSAADSVDAITTLPGAGSPTRPASSDSTLRLAPTCPSTATWALISRAAPTTREAIPLGIVSRPLASPWRMSPGEMVRPKIPMVTPTSRRFGAPAATTAPAANTWMGGVIARTAAKSRTPPSVTIATTPSSPETPRYARAEVEAAFPIDRTLEYRDDRLWGGGDGRMERVIPVALASQRCRTVIGTRDGIADNGRPLWEHAMEFD